MRGEVDAPIEQGFLELLDPEPFRALRKELGLRRRRGAEQVAGRLDDDGRDGEAGVKGFEGVRGLPRLRERERGTARSHF